MTGRLIFLCLFAGITTAALGQGKPPCFGWSGHLNVGYPGPVEVGGGVTLGNTFTNSAVGCDGIMFDASASSRYAKGTFGWRSYDRYGFETGGYEFGITTYSDINKNDAHDMKCYGAEAAGGLWFMQARGGVIRCPDGIKPVFMVGLFY